MMHTEKVILETNQKGQIIRLPTLPPNAQVEAVFLVLDHNEKEIRQGPSKKIAGKGKIIGDIMSPVVEAERWGALN